MTLPAPVQPDQDPARWDHYAGAYEQVFEPLTTALLQPVLARLGPLEGLDMLDVAAGAGGGALAALQRGARVTAVDGSAAMVSRIAARAPGVAARVMDGTALAFPDARFDLAISCFGVVLFPDPAAGLAEMRRVLRHGGRAAVVTWTEPHRYALATRLRDAVIAVRGEPLPMGELPAQLRFTDPGRLRALLADAAFLVTEIMPLSAELQAPSAEHLAAMLGFAPGMAAMLDALGPDRAAVLDRFTAQLQADQGHGPIRLGAAAHAAIAVKSRA